MNGKDTKFAIKNLDSVELETIGDGNIFEANIGRFGPLFDMKGLGCNVVNLNPGKKAWPYHLHYGHEELFVIIKGSGSIRYNDQMHEIRSGDVIFTPPGEGTAHQIINTSDQILSYLAISTKGNPEMCYYPDSGKYNSYFEYPDRSRKAFIAHESSAVNYFSGEDK